MPPSLLKSVNHDVGKAIAHYDMISHQDRILVGVSGGKDSLTLLWLLHERLSRIPVTYTLFPVYIDPGFPDGFADGLCAWVNTLGMSLRVEYTDDGIRAHSAENLENPCFMCARLRRKKIFEIAGELGCNKIAFGHHKDDIIETFFLNICFSGMMATMRPKLPLFDNRFSIIRPLAFVDENRIGRFAGKNKFPEFVNPCPYGKISRRKEIKDLLDQLYQTNQKIRGNIFRSLSNVNQDYLL